MAGRGALKLVRMLIQEQIWLPAFRWKRDKRLVLNPRVLLMNFQSMSYEWVAYPNLRATTALMESGVLLFCLQINLSSNGNRERSSWPNISSENHAYHMPQLGSALINHWAVEYWPLARTWQGEEINCGFFFFFKRLFKYEHQGVWMAPGWGLSDSASNSKKLKKRKK